MIGNGEFIIKLPVGEKVDRQGKAGLPARKSYSGKFVELSPVDPERDAEQLFEASHVNSDCLSIWTYMPFSGPFKNVEEMRKWLCLCRDHESYIYLTVRNKADNRAVGMASFVSIVPEMWRLELGFIWYTPSMQRSKLNTETIYLMLCEAFEQLSYRRVEWKCDHLNEKSKAAAKRLGFSYEGRFKDHMIVNGFNRDTAWFAMLESDWQKFKINYERWLYSEEEELSLREMNLQN